MWVIKNKKYNNYLKKIICDDQFNFVFDINEAKKFCTKWEVNKIIKNWNKKNIEIIEVN